MSAVLLVEDDRTLRRALRANFRNWDFDVAEAASGEEALSIVSDAPPDLVVLDLSLPGIDGLETLRHLRTFSDVPVVVLTVRDSLTRQGRGAGIGRRRLRAQAVRTRGASRAHAGAPAARRRRRSRLRSCGSASSSRPDREPGDVAGRAGASSRRPSCGSSRCSSPNRGRLVTRDELLDAVWGSRHPSDRGRVRVFMVHLRRKLHDDAARPRLILTEPGLGYRWIGDGEDSTTDDASTGSASAHANSSVGFLRFTKETREPSVIFG